MQHCVNRLPAAEITLEIIGKNDIIYYESFLIVMHCCLAFDSERSMS